MVSCHSILHLNILTKMPLKIVSCVSNTNIVTYLKDKGRNLLKIVVGVNLKRLHVSGFYVSVINSTYG